MYLLPLDANLISWVIKLLMTTGLLGLVFKFKLIIEYNKVFLLTNVLLIIYLTIYLFSYYNNYNLMIKMHYSDIDVYLEYIVLLLLIDYEGLITNGREFTKSINNKFKYSMFSPYRYNTSKYMEIKEGKKWN